MRLRLNTDKSEGRGVRETGGGRGFRTCGFCGSPPEVNEAHQQHHQVSPNRLLGLENSSKPAAGGVTSSEVPFQVVSLKPPLFWCPLISEVPSTPDTRGPGGQGNEGGSPERRPFFSKNLSPPKDQRGGGRASNGYRLTGPSGNASRVNTYDTRRYGCYEGGERGPQTTLAFKLEQKQQKPAF